MEERRKFGVENVFKSLNHISDMTFQEFKNVLETQQREYQKTMSNWMDISTDLGKNIMDVMEEENEDYQKLIDLWTDMTTMPEEMMEEELEKDFYEDFMDYNNQVGEMLTDMLADTYDDARELYHAWTSLTNSFMKGMKAGTGPDPDEMTQAMADFQQTAVHLALEELDNNAEDMKKLRNTLEEFSENMNEKINMLNEMGNQEYKRYVENWLENVNEMQSRVEEYMKEIQNEYVDSMEPYFSRNAIIPFFPWLPKRRMREYEQEIEELQDRILKLEKKWEEGD